MEKSRLRAAQYLRMSTDQQRYSIENQTSAIQLYAEARGLEIITTYADEGKSGLSVAGRDGLQALICDVVTGAATFEVIIVYDVSRWGRFQDADEAAHYEFICRRAGINIEYCAEPFANDGSPLSAVLKGVKRAMAGEYSRELSTKVFAGQKRQITNGFVLGGMCGYGFRRQVIDSAGVPKVVLVHGQRKHIRDDRIVLIPGPPEEVRTVRWIYRRYLSGAFVKNIANELQKRGVRSDTGKPFTVKLVNSVLTCERYVGTSVWNKTTSRMKGRRIRNRQEHWVRFPNAFPALIAQATFDAAQEERRKRRARLSDEEMLAPLRRLLKRKGFLSARLIDQTKTLPTCTSYLNRFGSMRRLYERVGYKPSNDYSYADVNKRLVEMRPTIFAKVIAAFRDAEVHAEKCSESKIIIEREASLSVAMSRFRQPRDYPKGWYTIQPKKLDADFFLFVRTNEANSEPADYYLFSSADLVRIRFCLIDRDRPKMTAHFCPELSAVPRRLSEFFYRFPLIPPATD